MGQFAIARELPQLRQVPALLVSPRCSLSAMHAATEPLLDSQMQSEQDSYAEHVRNLKVYAQAKPKIALETISSTAAKLVLFCTYAAFAVGVALDLHSQLTSHKTVRLNASTCRAGTYPTPHETSSCTRPHPSDPHRGSWEAYLTDLDNLYGSIKLEAYFPNGTARVNITSYTSIYYDVHVDGCYGRRDCNEGDFMPVLRISNDSTSLTTDAEIISTHTEASFKIFSIFQNQESLANKGRVKSYFVQVKFHDNGMLLDGEWDAEYIFSYYSPHATVVESSIEVILIACTLAFGVYWGVVLYRHEPNIENWLPEQKWLSIFLLGLLCYQNPVYTVAIFQDNPKLSVVYAAQILGLLSQAIQFVVWLFFADGFKRQFESNLSFYLPKVIFGFLLFTLSVSVWTITFPSLYGDRSPLLSVQNWDHSLQVAYITLSSTVIFMMLLWMLWYSVSLYVTAKELRKLPYMSTRYQQLSFRFFALQATLVGVAFISQYMTVFVEMVQDTGDSGVEQATDNMNRLLRTQSNSFGITLFISVYSYLTMYLHLPPSNIENKPLSTTYVLMEAEIRPVVARRKREKRRIRAVESIIDLKVEVFCVETALWLVELAWQAYNDPQDKTTTSGFGVLELDKLNYELVERIYDEQHDAYALVCRHKYQHRLVIAFRGSSSKAHWQANLRFKQQEFNMLKEKLLEIDENDGLGAVETGIGQMEDIIQGRATLHSEESDEDEEAERRNYRASEFFRDGAEFAARGVEGAVGLVRQGLAYGVSATHVDRLPGLNSAFNSFVHRGFLETYWVIRERLHMVVRKELAARPAHLYVTGHSLGGALATFAAFDLSVHSIPRINACLRSRAGSVGPIKSFNTEVDLDVTTTAPRRVQVTMYNFGSPRVGNRQFATQYNRVVPDSFRVVVDGDVVTAVPGAWYKHVGTEVVIDGESNTGTIIIDPSFVEKSLNTRPKRHLKSHSLVAYRSGLKAVDRAGRAMMDQLLRRRRVAQLTSLRLDDNLAHALMPVQSTVSMDLTVSDDVKPAFPTHETDPEAALERTSERDSEPGTGIAEEAETYMQSGFLATTLRTISRLYQPADDEE